MSVPLHEGLARLGVRRMLLAIHDVSFPSDPDEDLGRGSPATRAAGRLFDFARRLGFTGIQLGPQGQTARANPSPYDGTIFSRNLGNISVASLRAGGAFEGLVDEATISRALYAGGGRADLEHAYDATHELVDHAYEALERGARPDLRARVDAFRRDNASWLDADGLHAAIGEVSGGAGFRHWPRSERELWLDGDSALRTQLVTRHARAIDLYALGQLLVHEEHARVRERAAGLLLYGDLQVGYADSDAWRHAGAFLRGYLMGAPPSRTNPDGQPWGYPVLDPAQYGGAARDLVLARADKAFTEYDSLRIDHPHGLVCPWVYRSDTGDAAQAVRDGARLFESPDLADHPALAAFAIARPDQLRRDHARYADDWVHDLDAGQIDRYATLVDLIIHAAEKRGRSRTDLSCEVLSTMPTPLASILARHGLGRWRVTQKADMDDARDVYRTENAVREDWVMLGNHDTPPILSVIRGWSVAHREKWERHLTSRLRLAQPERLASDGFLATAMLAELFACRAENVSIFFADLFGFDERFNVPGLVDRTNWTLRLPPDFDQLHADRVARESALDLPLAVDLALAATGP
ncbi:MAG TPA: 4-alpha-glucanotransferase [Kofleriaceae bacterium]|nr:4-alpha-glucanotransferase [Kofleriaceae bacterium]